MKFQTDHRFLLIMAIICGVLLVIGTTFEISAGAVCGDTVTVVSGDTLSAIASRCNTTVNAILRANPEIDSPRRLQIGMTLRMPEGDDPLLQGRVSVPESVENRTTGARVQITPELGGPGTVVTVKAAGFPPNTAIEIGAGPANSEYQILERTRSDAAGNLTEALTLPAYADTDARWVFVAETQDHRIEARSEPFLVQEAVAAGTPKEIVEEGEDWITVRGTLTDEGVECQVLRGADGRLYTLAGNVGYFEPGDRVIVKGPVAEMSICQQGTTIDLKQIVRWQDAPTVEQ